MKKRKYKASFERDYNFYYGQRHNFSFAGIDIKANYDIQFPEEPDHESGPWRIPYFKHTGATAKECFYLLDAEGKRECCSEPELLVELLTCKAAINLQIKLWAQSRAEYTLSLLELQEYMEYYQAPDWVLKAVENQKTKIIKDMVASGKHNWHPFYLEAMIYNLGETLGNEEIRKAIAELSGRSV